MNEIKEEITKKNKFNLNGKEIIICIIAVIIFFVFTSETAQVDLEDVKDSVVKIEIYNDSNKLIAMGSGFCAYEPNYIVTNYHVIKGATSIKIIDDSNETYDVNNILIFNVKNDLAILDTTAELNPIKFGSFNSLDIDSDVTSIGSPNGKLNTITYGKVSEKDNKGVLTTAEIDSGSSGGVLLNDKNKLVGITSRGNKKKNLNYSISVNYLKKLKRNMFLDNYFLINNSNYYDCIQSFETIEKKKKIEFNNCDTNDKNYSVIGMNSYSNVAVPKKIYEKNIHDYPGWSSIYDSLPNKKKDQVVAYYTKLIEEDFCKSNCNISKDFKSWTVADFFINLDILNKYELALVTIDMENCSSFKKRYKRVDDYPLDAAQMCLILWIIGDGKWDDITEQNKKDVFDYLKEKDLSTKELGKILKYLGYYIEYNKDGSLTAYWN